MPEDTDEELGIPEGLDPNIRAELRKSRELGRDAEAANKRAAELERQLAFSQAGVPDTPLAAAGKASPGGGTVLATALVIGGAMALLV